MGGGEDVQHIIHIQKALFNASHNYDIVGQMALCTQSSMNCKGWGCCHVWFGSCNFLSCQVIRWLFFESSSMCNWAGISFKRKEISCKRGKKLRIFLQFFGGFSINHRILVSISSTLSSEDYFGIILYYSQEALTQFLPFQILEKSCERSTKRDCAAKSPTDLLYANTLLIHLVHGVKRMKVYKVFY